jgi:acyl-CoA synthetase (AMP-forming)/AMP-acid ligase II
VYPASFCTLVEALAAAPSERPFVTMWHDEEDVRTISFGEFRSQAESTASYFRLHGLQPGDPVILIMPQGVDLMTAFVGAMLAGAVPAILAYPNFKVEPEKYRLGLAGVTANLNARMIVIDEAFPSALMDCVAVSDSALVLRGIARTEPSPETLLSMPPLEPDSLAFIQHSAGTTGLQKGVALSHAAVLRQLSHLAIALQINDQDSIYSWLPLYHDMGLISCFMLPLVCHIPIVMQSPTDWVMQPATMLELVSEHRCTLAWVPNFTLQFLARRVRREDRDGFDLSSLRAMINCSEPVRAQSMDEFTTTYESSGLRSNVLQSSYAMAENVFAVTQSDIEGKPVRLWVDGDRLRNEHIAVTTAAGADGSLCFVSSGRCLPGNEVRIASADGETLPDGLVGEILIRSDSLFDGYYNRPDLTAQVLQEGWYWSGDLGFCRDGELYVIGRKKDLIIVAGKNVYPQDVEEIAFAHPSIHDGRAVSFGLYNSALGTEDIVVVAEVERVEELEEALQIERSLRNDIVAELGVAVRAVYLKPPKWIVKSTAGKAARAATKEKLIKEHPELDENDAGWGTRP